MSPDIPTGSEWRERDAKARLERTIVVTSVQADQVYCRSILEGKSAGVGMAIYDRADFGPRGRFERVRPWRR